MAQAAGEFLAGKRDDARQLSMSQGTICEESMFRRAGGILCPTSRVLLGREKRQIVVSRAALNLIKPGVNGDAAQFT